MGQLAVALLAGKFFNRKKSQVSLIAYLKIIINLTNPNIFESILNKYIYAIIPEHILRNNSLK